jgi:alkylation response protein AidB-like acyl-CoA dehydrogenase
MRADAGSSVRALRPLSLDRLPEVTRRLAADAQARDRDAAFPHAGIAAVHEAGLLTATVHRRHGGPGCGLADTVAILHALGRGDPSVALVAAMTLIAHAMQQGPDAWSETSYTALLRESATGPALVNALRVEPDLGTPARGGLPATVARRTGDGWQLSGHKIFSTGAVALSRMVVHARTDEPAPRVGGFVVVAGAAGVRVEPTWDHLGLRASRSDDVVFVDTPVAADHVVGLGPAGTSRPADPATAVWSALTVPAIYLGVARAALDWLVGFLHARVPTALGTPLAALPRFRSAVGEIDAGLAAAEDLVAGLAARQDGGEPGIAPRAAGAKVVATRAAIGAVESAVALVGNNGLTRTNPLERHLRDVLCARVHTPQDDAVAAALGAAALGAAEGRPEGA